MTNPVEKILIYGSGLAFEYAVAALTNVLSPSVKIIAIEAPDPALQDAFYGNATTPSIYNFHLEAGLSEPDLVLNTDTVFSFGTHYLNWGSNRDWVQGFSLPFPIWDGVQFHHYLIRTKGRLEEVLAGAIAGKAGKFAHPPADQNVIFSRAEYGYQFDPFSITNVLKSKKHRTNDERIKAKLSKVVIENGSITALKLESGDQIDADFYIDASGVHGDLIGALDTSFTETFTYFSTVAHSDCDQTGAPLRSVQPNDNGWVSTTPLAGKNIQVAVTDSIDDFAARNKEPSFEIATGKRSKAWVANCVGIGQAISVIEPLTPAPLVMLQHDIQRLLRLIPVTKKMDIEAREFNRLFDADYENTTAFNDALYQTENLPDSSFWRQARSRTLSEKLTRKLNQFESRGALISYDLEPFNEQDWAILHFGMGRTPDRTEIFIDHIPESAIKDRLHQMKSMVDNLVPRMPDHDRYLANFKRYLEKRK